VQTRPKVMRTQMPLLTEKARLILMVERKQTAASNLMVGRKPRAQQV
jgi:hypothetical protein